MNTLNVQKILLPLKCVYKKKTQKEKTQKEKTQEDSRRLKKTQKKKKHLKNVIINFNTIKIVLKYAKSLIKKKIMI